VQRDKNWEMLNAALQAEAAGRAPRLFSSRRTLFGIPSALDEELAQIASASAAAAASSQNDASDQAKSAKGSEGVTGGAPAAGGGTGAGAGAGAGAHEVHHTLAPVYAADSRVLILGTMPSPKSRELGFYYMHPQNRFWPALAAALGAEPPAASAAAREAFVRAHKIALWDVLASCTIEGARDATIANCVPNNIAQITKNSQVKAVFCTGGKAWELYQKFCESEVGLPAFKLPSPSAANAAARLDALIEAYKKILPYLDE
jgi:hypoxanthine-DNA glycosylase